MNQEEGPHQDCAGRLDLGLFSLQDCEQYISVVYKLPNLVLLLLLLLL